MGAAFVPHRHILDIGHTLSTCSFFNIFFSHSTELSPSIGPLNPTASRMPDPLLRGEMNPERELWEAVYQEYRITELKWGVIAGKVCP